MADLLGNWRRHGNRRGAADLAAAIELQVQDGQLPLGTRLPAERELAEALGASRTMVAAALDRLRESGMVASRRGAGSWVAARASGLPPAPAADTGLIDLTRASPPAISGLVPAFDAARQRLPEQLSKTGYTGLGLLDLRERVAQRYTDRGLPTTPDQVMITNGALHAFVLALRLLAGPGDRVLVEQPSYPSAFEAIRAAHAVPVPVALGERGWDLAGIEAALRQAGPRLAFLIPDFQNPTGLRLDAEGRERIGTALARARTPVVVDETLVDVDLTGDPGAAPPPLAGTAPDWVITIGSAAKSFWGGLRLGWLRASEDLLGRLQAARFAVDLGSPVLEQLALSELLADAEPSLAKRREEVTALRDALVGALRWYCPDWEFRVPDGGFSLWCRLPEPMSTRLAVAAAGHGVQVVPGARFGAHGGLERWVRLPYSLPAEQLYEAVRRLSAAAASVRGSACALDAQIT
ncbi:PLP-dependent aminotransferase family protein [Amycolatopsis suaedae]|uniref:PLP-dependent aminotransferase family protein n=1 Tax=Amycolatopsis suaedae TaxID=2510978 RepID=A0A4Q7JB14_9PSEU|nr:PLP-dependent aminotransferase family protein [Amycolatopsis suaedae]